MHRVKVVQVPGRTSVVDCGPGGWRVWSFAAQWDGGCGRLRPRGIYGVVVCGPGPKKESPSIILLTLFLPHLTNHEA